MTDRYYELDQEERQIQKQVESGELQRVPNLADRRQELQRYARNTLNKSRNINIRLSERDLYKLKAKAIEEGVPYQTLASSILHKATK